MDELFYPRGVDSAGGIQVIETRAAKGVRTEKQPSRMVTLLAEVNPTENRRESDEKESPSSLDRI